MGFKFQKQASYYFCFEDIHLRSLLEILLRRMPNSFLVELAYVFLSYHLIPLLQPYKKLLFTTRLLEHNWTIFSDSLFAILGVS
jgi:aspartokinase-like uncharacterized kinase